MRHGELEVRMIAGEEDPADLYTKHLEQLINLFAGKNRGGRAAAAPQLRKDPSGSMADMRVLPHLMSSHEINDFCPVVKFDGGESMGT